MTLTKEILDERAKVLISLCARYDYHTYTGLKLSEEVIHEISPRYYIKEYPNNKNRILIAHCRDDKIIPFSNLVQIQQKLQLSDDNVIIYDSGGHSFKGDKSDLFTRILKFLRNNEVDIL
ncbi:MAG: hypothetical protein JW891_16015 [Candidatus Lokiarchaeota archaeon]|nr:hypothetical protein [Candidatus Lokiarchaeota archaeon]